MRLLASVCTNAYGQYTVPVRGGFYSISQPHRFLLHKRVVFEGGVYQSMKMSELAELISPTM